MSVANVKDDNEMIPEAVHRSPGICLTAEENPAKPQLRDRLIKGLYLIASNGVPFLQIWSVGSHSASGREKEGIKERTGWVGFIKHLFNSSFQCLEASIHASFYFHEII